MREDRRDRDAAAREDAIARLIDPRRVGPPPAIPRRDLLGSATRLSTRSAAIFIVVGLVAWLTLVFGTALARVDAVNAEAARTRAENAALQATVDAGRREIALIQTDAFMAREARAFGMGDAGERPFALEPDAPPPARIVPLGAEPTSVEARGPLEEWLDLLFG